jgi:hypothetical protein
VTCERFEFPGGVATVCSRGRRAKAVSPCACGNPTTHACDFPTGKRKTCSARLCEKCRTQRDGKDYCPAHAEMDPVDKRICTKCRLEKPITDYHRDASKLDGLSIWCKACKRVDRLRREPPKPRLGEAAGETAAKHKTEQSAQGSLFR